MMTTYNRRARVGLHYHLRIIAMVALLQPCAALADIEPPISEDHWPKTYVYLPTVSKAQSWITR
jgi:hypothetical protein